MQGAKSRLKFAGRTLLDPFWLPLIFLLFAGLTCTQLVLVTPVGHVADEPAHIARAAALLHGQIIGRRASGPHYQLSGVDVNTGIIAAAVSELPPLVATQMLNNDHVTTGLAIFPLRVSAAQRRAAHEIKWGGATALDDAPGAVLYFPAFYLPATIGLAAGRLFGAAPFNAIILGRFAMLATFLAVGVTALTVARFGRGFIFATLMLPSTLNMAASFNQGALLISTFALTAALLTLHDARWTRLRFCALPLTALAAASQPPFSALLLASLIPLRPRRALRYLALVGLFAAPVVLWTILMAHYALIPTRRLPYHPGPLWPGDHSLVLTSTIVADNLHVLLAEPVLLIVLPILYVYDDFAAAVTQAIGVLGWLHIFLARPVYIGWAIALITAATSIFAGEARRGIPWRAADAALIASLQLLTALGITLSMYLAWSAVGAPMIDGVQGRYFLLLFPFSILVIPRFGRPASRARWAQFEMLLTFPAITMGALDLFYLPQLMRAYFAAS